MVHTFDLLFEKDKDVISTLQSKLYKENKTYLSEYPSILIYLSYLYENESVKLSSEKVLNQIVKYASLLVDAIKKNDQNNVSLCYGLTGIAYAFSYCHKKTGLFDNIVNTVEKSLVRLAQEEIHKIRGEKRQVMEADFDLLLGLGGCANYFLAKQVISREEEELLKQILLYFSILLENEGENARIQKDVMVMDYLRDEYPDGYISMGAAHGILAAIFALTQAYERTNKIEYLTALRKGISIYNSSIMFYKLKIVM